MLVVRSTHGLAGVLAAAVALALAQPGPALAGDEALQGAVSGDLAGLSDDEIDARISFIEERLDDDQLHAQIWQYGFTAGYGLGALYGTIGASVTNDNDQRVEFIVTGAKAFVGVGRLLYAPHPGRHGAEAIRELPGETREDRLRRLTVAEELLDENADRARSRWAWQRHLTNVALNMAGFGVIWTLGEEGSAISSTLVGIAVGEAMAFSMPWRAEDDLEDYRARFAGAERDRVSWSLEPMVLRSGSGLALRVNF
jgi:hypothetical protein